MAEDNECQPKTTNWLGIKKYDNPKQWKDWYKPGAFSFAKMKLTESNNAGIPFDNKEKLQRHLPVHKITDIGKKQLKTPTSDIRIMWIGHATLLVQFDGITVLTDPVFADRCSPSTLVGPKRYRPVPCQIEDLPPIDAVVISHNHYDHLETAAVENLNRKFGYKIRWFVPEGLRQWFIDTGCSNVEEMTWWQEETLSDKNNTKFICTPAQHWSQRTPFDAMKSLWCGWVVKGPTKTFYYTGDTGYCPVFKTIGEKFGPMDLSAIPIGCYEPRYFMKPQHIGPEDAVKIHQEVKSRKSVGIHWGTFNGLGSNEHYLEPRKLLKGAVADNNLSEDDFFTVEHGEIKVINENTNSSVNNTHSKTSVDEDYEKSEFPFNKYATKKTLAKGLLDISLLMANASQLKAILNAGPSVHYYWVVVILIAVSVALQVVVGIMLLILGSKDWKGPEEKRRVNVLNDCSVAFIAIITIVNVFIAAFGIKISD